MSATIKVLVTGANGMLGLNICKELVKQGYLVKGITLPNSILNIISDINIEIVYGNILDKDFLLKVMSDCEFVIHTAALTSVWPRRSKLVMTTNIEGTRNIMEIAEKLKMKRMVHIGTACSFKHGPKEKPGDETNLYAGWEYGMDYIDSKYLAQEMLLEKHSQNGFPVIIVNPTYMIGPFDSKPTSGKMIIELLNTSIMGYSAGGKNFVCATDVAKASVNALKLGRLGECYIVGNENLNYKDFFMKVCYIKNKKFRFLKVPYFLILIFGIINSVMARLISKPPKLSYSMARFASISQFYSSEKAEKELNISLTPIENGIDLCLKWFESNGYIK